RVVAAMRDPNPAVAGKGFEQLRAAGIDVVEGILEAEARKLNEAFARYIRTGVPFVTLKSAMSLDGRIALPPRGKPVTPSTTYLIGVSALRQVHCLRHASDAILVGIGTALADDPLLTDRSGLERRRPLMRVVLDSELRLPLDSRIVDSAGVGRAGDVVVFCCRASDEAKRALESRGVRVEVAPESATSAQPRAAGPTLDLNCVLKALGEMQVASVLLEGGAKVSGAFLRAGLVDKVWLFYAPKIFGGGVPLASSEEGGCMAEATLLPNITLHHYDEDFAVEGYLRDPYR
ncbi:MAG TPA: bifunctional diaminohydroxyphosphoribosylaminopyrimidine deaminase/5-amino-6-(5-phosphoribosylamino)uracil reductase RibD, partial [Terracidiphilus sp.]|nr:bifunctional diaminohydroxyphosphoribosylaminopyrimidine deaminase/5-amino-6-(5-phosphoribosylamino)uracil reductase RibD [Terracidiphilus sp.]